MIPIFPDFGVYLLPNWRKISPVGSLTRGGQAGGQHLLLHVALRDTGEREGGGGGWHHLGHHNLGNWVLWICFFCFWFYHFGFFHFCFWGFPILVFPFSDFDFWFFCFWFLCFGFGFGFCLGVPQLVPFHFKGEVHIVWTLKGGWRVKLGNAK